MSEFTEQSLAEDIITELDEYIPCLDNDRQYMRKYCDDFLYHYNNGFYNLALFSFHYIYMFIINISMVKYYAFKEDIIRNQTGNKNNREMELFGYFGHQPEKRVIHNNVVNFDIRELHEENVSHRDRIAHSSGYVAERSNFIDYINNCFEVIRNLQPVVLSNCYQDNLIKEKWLDINQDILDAIWSNNSNSFEEIIINFLIDYYLSYKDILMLDSLTTELNAIKFLRQYLSIESGYFTLSYNEEEDLHQALFDSFTTNYQQAFEDDDINILSKDDIINVLVKLNNNKKSFVVDNVYSKLMENSLYWIPFENQNRTRELNN